MQLIFGVKLGWTSPTVGGDWTVGDLILPAIVLAIANFAYTIRLTRTSVAENLSADHVRTARAKGLSERLVIRNHVLRNSLVPVVTYIGINLGSLMAGAIITETIFNVPGIGNAAYIAIAKGETSTVVAIVTFMVMIYVLHEPAGGPDLRRTRPEDPLCLRHERVRSASSRPSRRPRCGPSTRSTSTQFPRTSGRKPGSVCGRRSCSGSPCSSSR